MKTHCTLAVIVIFCLLFNEAFSRQINRTRYTLHKEVFEHYNKNVRPVLAGSHNDTATEIHLTYNMRSILNVNEQDQVFITSGILYMQWMDDALKWDITKYDNATTMLIRQVDMWIPDIYIANSVSQPGELGYENGPILVKFKGIVTWQPQIVSETKCKLDITFFPFDIQHCEIKIASRVSMSEEIRLKIMQTVGAPFLNRFSPNGQWQLIRTDSSLFEGTNTLSAVTIRVTMRRRPLKILCNIFIPILFLSVAANLVFLLPIDGGERTGTAVTILLAYAVYLSFVADSLPMNALKTCCFEIYLLCLIGVATMIAVTNVLVESKFRREGNVSLRTTKHLTRLRSYLCMEPCKQKRQDSSGKGNDIECENLNQETRVISRDSKSTNIMTCVEASQVLNRMCFLVFAVLTVLVSIIFFSIVIMGEKKPENNVLNSKFPYAGE